MAKAKARKQLRGFADCEVQDIFAIDPGDSVMLVIAARELKTDRKQLLQLSVSSIGGLTRLANRVMDFLSDQEDARINIGSEMRPK